MILSRLVLSLSLLLAGAQGAQACPSDFDNFGNNGRSEQPDGLNGEGHDTAVTPGGAILVAASVDGKPAVLRYESDGDFDGSFGEDGVAHLVPAVTGSFTDIALLGDGSILVAGTVNVPRTPGSQVFVPATILARFDATGQIDEDFGDEGFTLVRFGDQNWPHDLLVRSDGVIVTVGQAFNGDASQATIFFFSSSGNIAAALGGSRSLPGFASAAANSVTEAANKALIVAGTDLTGDGGTVFLVKFTGLGAIDTSFASNGFRRVRSPDVIEDAAAVEVDANGRIYLSGTAVPPDRPRRMRDFVRRFTAGGARDGSYGARGVAKVRPGGRWVVRDMHVSDDGVATLASTRSRVGSILIRFESNGLVDRAFGHLGISGILVENLESADVLPNGKIVSGGSFENAPIVLRFEGGEWDGEEACVEDCGNGDLEIMEECDDGNVTNGDGCSAACLEE